MGPQTHKNIEFDGKFYEQSLEKTASAYYNINRFLSAFIDHVSVHFEFNI